MQEIRDDFEQNLVKKKKGKEKNKDAMYLRFKPRPEMGSGGGVTSPDSSASCHSGSKTPARKVPDRTDNVPVTPEGNDAASAASGSKTPARKIPDWTDNVPVTPKGNDAASAASEPVSSQSSQSRKSRPIQDWFALLQKITQLPLVAELLTPTAEWHQR
jgi:hypothetical protein